ncbi:lysosomal alpha-glucosidase [Ixodes scapularis]
MSFEDKEVPRWVRLTPVAQRCVLYHEKYEGKPKAQMSLLVNLAMLLRHPRRGYRWITPALCTALLILLLVTSLRRDNGESSLHNMLNNVDRKFIWRQELSRLREADKRTTSGNLKRLGSSEPECDSIPPVNLVDCHPDIGVDPERCWERDCCWSSHESDVSPGCYRPPSHKRYRVLKETHGDNGSSVSLLLTLAPEIPDESLFVSVELVKYSYDTVRIRVLDTSKTVYEPPVPPIVKKSTVGVVGYNAQIGIDGIVQVTAKKTGSIMFKADLTQLIFAERLIQLPVRLPSNFVYGLRSHVSLFHLNITGWTQHVFYTKGFPKKVGPSYFFQSISKHARFALDDPCN